MNGVRIRRTRAPDITAASDGRLTLSVPIQFKRRSGRKLVTLPNGATSRPWDVAATPMQLALGRGHRWLAILESGEVKSITELATREKIDNSYLCRTLNLTTLAPDIVAVILDETLPHHVGVHELAISPPVLWAEQRSRMGVVGSLGQEQANSASGWPRKRRNDLTTRNEADRDALHFLNCVSKMHHIAHRGRSGLKGKTRQAAPARAKQFQEGEQSPDNDKNVVKKRLVPS